MKDIELTNDGKFIDRTIINIKKKTQLQLDKRLVMMLKDLSSLGNAFKPLVIKYRNSSIDVNTIDELEALLSKNNYLTTTTGEKITKSYINSIKSISYSRDIYNALLSITLTYLESHIMYIEHEESNIVLTELNGNSFLAPTVAQEYNTFKDFISSNYKHLVTNESLLIEFYLILEKQILDIIDIPIYNSIHLNGNDVYVTITEHASPSSRCYYNYLEGIIKEDDE